MTLRAYRAGANAAYDAIDSRRTNAATIMSQIKKNLFGFGALLNTVPTTKNRDNEK